MPQGGSVIAVTLVRFAHSFNALPGVDDYLSRGVHQLSGNVEVKVAPASRIGYGQPHRQAFPMQGIAPQHSRRRMLPAWTRPRSAPSIVLAQINVFRPGSVWNTNERLSPDLLRARSHDQTRYS